MLKGIFWDNDGVLVDTETLYYQASAEILGSIGIVLTRAAFSTISLQRGESVFDLAAPRPAEEIESLRRARDERYAELLKAGVRVMDGVEAVLQTLTGRLRMAVVTSSRRQHFELIHRSTGLLRHFEFVLTREDYRQSKPHPEPYLTALRRSGLAPEECVVIEDSERGLTAACRAGLRCLVVPGGLTRSGDFSAAGRILESIGQVPEALGEMAGGNQY